MLVHRQCRQALEHMQLAEGHSLFNGYMSQSKDSLQSSKDQECLHLHLPFVEHSALHRFGNSTIEQMVFFAPTKQKQNSSKHTEVVHEMDS